MRAAVIDLGSNSIRLLVADFLEDSVVTVHKDLITTRLGSGVAQNRRLDDTSMTATLSALIYFKDKESYGKQIYPGFGTSALRDAKNSNVLVEKRIGLAVDILSERKRHFYHFRCPRRPQTFRNVFSD